MGRNGYRWIVALVALIGGLAALAGAAGVLLRGDLATTLFTTVRGERVDVLTGGIYRYNGLNIASEGVGWDAVTLFLVVPALALSLPALWRESTRAKLFLVGILAYFLYQYAEYAFTLAYGPLFLLYVAIFALSLSAIALLVSTVDLGELAASVTPRFPHRAVVGLGLFMAGLLALMWLPLIVRTAGGEVQDVLYGGTTLVVQAFDLGFLVPLGLFTAATVHRRLPVGFLLASVVVVKAVAMATAIFAMLVFEFVATGELAVAPMVVFALTALGSAALGVRVYGSIGESAVEASALRREAAGAAPFG